MTRSFQIVSDPSKRVEATLTVPADKSISHRAIILSSLAKGTTTIHNFLAAQDTLHTLQIFQQMGVNINRDGATNTVTVTGVGLHGLRSSSTVLDVGNSGTGIRLILGILSGQPFKTTITGDASIQKRPMKRVVDPLTLMGATFSLTPTGTAPVTVTGKVALNAIDYAMPVSSAQVKSAILFAGLYANGPTVVRDPGRSRDHTERMMRHFGVQVENPDATSVIVFPPPIDLVSPKELTIPSDISSAAFWMVLAAIRPNTILTLLNVGLNPTRTGIIDVMTAMKVNINVSDIRQVEGEPIGDITVKSSRDGLTAVTLDQSTFDMATFIDEIPIIAVLAAFASGVTTIRDAQELRVKESDRIQTTLAMLKAFGVVADELPDGLRITGGTVQHVGTVESHGDHRIAMAGSILSLAIEGRSGIIDVDCVDTSYPGFAQGLSLMAAEVIYS